MSITYITRLIETISHGKAKSFLVKSIRDELQPPAPPPVIPEPEFPDEGEVGDDAGVKEFDYAIVRYSWTNANGRDLDTRTYIKVPNREAQMVGWSRAIADGSYLRWNEDNREVGVESILINMQDIVRDYPAQEKIVIYLRAWWYNSVADGKVKIEFITYKGGQMVTSGYDWINPTGEKLQHLSLNTRTMVCESESTQPGEHLATVEFDTQTKVGRLIRAGEGTELPVEPEPEIPEEPLPPPVVDPEPPAMVYEDNAVVFRVNSPVPSNVLIKADTSNHEWDLYHGDEIIATHNSSVSDTVDFRGDIYTPPSWNIKVPSGIKEYRIVPRMPTIETMFTLNALSDVYNEVCSIEVKQFGTGVSSLKLNIKGINLKVPDYLPPNITSMYYMFENSDYFNQDLSAWDVSNVIDAEGAFYGCTRFNGNVTTWNTVAMLNMKNMFTSANSFNQNIGNWDVSNNGNFHGMFEGCSSFNQDISSWDVSKPSGGNYMDSMFYDCVSFNQDLSSWNVTAYDSEPYAFASRTDSWVLPKPIWGTNAGVVIIPEDAFVFSLTGEEGTDVSVKASLGIRGMGWELRDADTYQLYATDYGSKDSRLDFTEFRNDRNYLEGGRVTFTSGFPHKVNLLLKFGNSWDAQVSLFTFGTSSLGAKRAIEVKQYSYKVMRIVYSAPNTEIILPPELPSHFTTLYRMFDGCNLFNQDISGWDTSNIVSMRETFMGCTNFNQPIGVWDVSNVTDMRSMFNSASNFNQDLSGWNVSKQPVEPKDFAVNADAWVLPKPDWGSDGITPVREFSRLDMVVNGYEEYDYNPALYIHLHTLSGQWEFYFNGEKVGDHTGFKSGNFATSKSGEWTKLMMTSGTDSLNGDRYTLIGANAVYGNINLYDTTDDIGELDVKSFSDGIGYYRFRTQALDLTMPAAIPPTLTGLDDMFNGCTGMNCDISSWDVSNVTDMTRMFSGCKNFNQSLNTWNTSNVKSMEAMFFECTSFDQPLDNWNVSAVTNMQAMFSLCTVFNQNLNTWVTTSLANTSFMFNACKAYNQPMDNWHMGSVTTTESMFKETAVFNQPLNMWDMRMNTNMGWMFRAAASFNQDLNDWNTSNVTILSSMFEEASSFNGLVGNWDVSKVTNMGWTFYGCSVFNQDISEWNTSNVSVMTSMFNKATLFNQNLNKWNVSLIAAKPDWFDYLVADWTLPQPIWGTSGATASEVDYLPIKLDGSSGYILTVSRNGQPSVTLDLTDPTLNPVTDFVPLMLTDDQAAVAFFTPDSIPLVDGQIDVSQITALMGFNDTNKVAMPGYPEGMEVPLPVDFMGTTITPPGEYVPVVNTLKVAPTPGELPSTDIYYSLPNSHLHNEITLVSKSSLVIASQSEPAPVIETIPGALEFKLSGELGTAAKPFRIAMGNLSSEWAVYQNGVIIADPTLSPPAGVTIDTSKVGWFAVDIANDSSSETTYQVVYKAAAGTQTWYDYIKLTTPTYSSATGTASSNIDITQFNKNTINMVFELKDTTFELNDVLPANVTSMDSMFSNANLFNADISAWDTSNVTDMGAAFSSADNFNCDISKWDTSNVTNMNYMFTSASKFNQDLSGWNVSKIPSEPELFSMGASAWTLPKPVWGTTGGTPVLPPALELPDNPLTFNVVNKKDTTGEKYLTVKIAQPVGDWELRRNGEVIVNSAGLVTGGTALRDAPTSTIIKIAAPVPNDGVKSSLNENSYELYGNIGTVTFGHDDSYPSDKEILFTLNDFTPNVKNLRLSLRGYAEVIVPETLPTWITSLKGLFEACRYIVTSVVNWDVSNVTDFNSMFSGASNFNQDISKWDVSKATNMISMFSGATRFNQDLSSWNVVNFPTMPYEFYNLNDHNWRRAKPVWGTDGTVVENDNFTGSIDVSTLGTPFLFNTEASNYSVGEVNLVIGIPPDTTWQLVDVARSKVLANSAGHVAEQVTAAYDSYDRLTWITLDRTGLNGSACSYALYTNALSVMFKNKTGSGSTIGALNMVQWGGITTRTIFDYRTHPLTVPNYLPPTYVNCSSMFTNCTGFNQDISGWDTSNVTNMSRMFASATTFNQDLSSWNVSKIATKPTSFDATTTAWKLPKPVWGSVGKPMTVPLIVDYLPLKLDGSAGIALTIIKNDNEPLTLNLADPSLDPMTALMPLLMNDTMSGLTFMNYPDINSSDGTIDVTKLESLSGFKPNGNVSFPSSISGERIEGPFTFAGTLIPAPLKFKEEINRLKVVPTPGVDKTMDIYYSLPGANRYSEIILESKAILVLPMPS